MKSDSPSAKPICKPWFLYLIRCRKGSLYCGVTTNVERRFKEHQSGSAKSARYLRGRGPLTLVFHEQVGDRSEALKMEYRVKQQSKATKEVLVAGTLTLAGLSEMLEAE